MPILINISSILFFYTNLVGQDNLLTLVSKQTVSALIYINNVHTCFSLYKSSEVCFYTLLLGYILIIETNGELFLDTSDSFDYETTFSWHLSKISILLRCFKVCHSQINLCSIKVSLWIRQQFWIIWEVYFWHI